MDQLRAIIQLNDLGYSLIWICDAWVSFVNSLIHLNETYQSWVIIGWGILGIAWAFKEPWVLGRSLVWYQKVTNFMSGIIRLSCWVCLAGTPVVSFTTGPLSELPAGTHMGLRSQPVLDGCFLCLLLIFFMLWRMISYIKNRTRKNSSLLCW